MYRGTKHTRYYSNKHTQLCNRSCSNKTHTPSKHLPAQSLHILVHRFPDERTPIEVTPLHTPLSATFAEVGLGVGRGLGLDSLSHFCSHALPFFSPPSFKESHTIPFPHRSLVCGGQPSLHKPWLVVSHSTCPPLSSSPHAHSFVLGTAVINKTI